MIEGGNLLYGYLSVRNNSEAKQSDITLRRRLLLTYFFKKIGTESVCLYQTLSVCSMGTDERSIIPNIQEQQTKIDSEIGLARGTLYFCLICVHFT